MICLNAKYCRFRYEKSLLAIRHLLLEEKRYHVVSACGFDEALNYCRSGEEFALFILGHSIPHAHKEALVSAFHASSSGRIVSLKRCDEPPVQGADFQIEPNPTELLGVVANAISDTAESP